MRFFPFLLLEMITKVISTKGGIIGDGDYTLNNSGNTKNKRQLQLPEFTDPVIIVGGGLAGLSATLQAIHDGANVVLIEGEKDLGGNSQKASSGVAACNTEAQRVRKINDSVELFYFDTMSAGDRENDHILVEQLVNQSAVAIQFLIDHGVDLSDVNLCGGHSVKRVHWIPQPKEGKPVAVGFSIIKALKEKLGLHRKNHPEKIRVLLGTEVIGLVTWNDFVTGVRVRNESQIAIKELTSLQLLRLKHAMVKNNLQKVVNLFHLPNNLKLKRRKNGEYHRSQICWFFRCFLDGFPRCNLRYFEEISGKAVILATGGFSCDHSKEDSLLQEFAPEKASFPTTNGPWATGRGVKMARAMGAALVGMQNVQIHPTAFVDPKDPSAATKFLAAEALRGKGAILINHKGERFVNELGRRDHVTDKILKFCAKNKEAADAHTAFMLLDDQAVSDFGRASFGFYARVKGFFKEFTTLEEVANYMKVDSSKLRATVDEYNEYAHLTPSKEDKFGKKVFPVTLDHPPYYVAVITPAIHYTMGGVKIDKDAAVYNEFSGKPFKGLLAAGEVTGGVHGRNRLAGNSLLECVVYGRIAGQNAANIRYSASDAMLARSDL
uniref:fumarate reductase (NADH) n=1 Tax=Setaria digitata TaxID=48799 RepID=A0A915PI25_9BILA